MTNSANYPMTDSAKYPAVPPPPGTPEKRAWDASEKEKWDALNAHMTPQFEGVRAYHEHCFAKYRVAVIGSLHAASAPDPDTPEFKSMLSGNSDNLMDQMRKDAAHEIRETNPKLWDEMAEESDGLAETLRQAGVKVIRNESNSPLPQGLLNLNAGWGGPRFLTTYAGPSYCRIIRNIFFHTWDNSLNGAMEFASREGTYQLFVDNPDLVYYSIPFPEPNVSVPGYGSLTMDVAAWRHLPGKHLLFGFGVKDESDIPTVLSDWKKAPHLTACGIPQAAEFMMRMLKREGFTHDIWFYDSNLSYHSDCVMANLKEGVIALPDLPNYGILGGGVPECFKDYEIVKMPVEEIALGAANQICLGDGRSIVVRTAKETMKRMKAAGVEPIPLKYDKIWAYYHSGPDCSDAEIWRENDPVKPVPDGPPPIG